MNINAINSFSNNNGINFESKKLPVNRVKLVGEVDGYVSEMLADNFKRIKDYAELNNLTVKLAQKGKNLLVNSGVKTSILDMGKMESGSEFLSTIIKNIRINSALKDGSKSLEQVIKIYA